MRTGKAGGRVLQLVDLHGDVVATVPIPDGQVGVDVTALTRSSFDEFGNPEPLTSAASANAPPAGGDRYGWLGAAQRSADTPTGAVLMGVRLYSPVVGRFLQVDPVPGGSASAYDYCNADPVNCTDLGGTFSWKGPAKVVAVVAEVASFVPGPVGAIAGGISAVAYAASGDTATAIVMAAVAAAQLVGAGPAVRIGAGMVSKATHVGRSIGQAALRAAVKADRAVVVGQTMSRVEAAAAHYGASVYKGLPGYSSIARVVGERAASGIGKAHNAMWLASVKLAGRKVIDIGRNIAVNARSANYEMELRMLKGYANKVRFRWPAKR